MTVVEIMTPCKHRMGITDVQIFLIVHRMVTKTRTGALQGCQGAAGLAGADLEGVPSPLPTSSPKLHLAKLQPRLAKNAFRFTTILQCVARTPKIQD